MSQVVCIVATRIWWYFGHGVMCSWRKPSQACKHGGELFNFVGAVLSAIGVEKRVLAKLVGTEDENRCS